MKNIQSKKILKQIRHIIFFVDVSGSMDDGFLFCNNDVNMIQNTHRYSYDKFNCDTSIQIPFLPKIGFKLILQSDNESSSITTPPSDIDEIF